MYVNWFVRINWIACHANELFNSRYSYTHMNTLNNGWMHLTDSIQLRDVQEMINVFIMNQMNTKCLNSFVNTLNTMSVWHEDILKSQISVWIYFWMLWQCDKWMWITYEYILACLNNFLWIQIRLIQFMRLMHTPEWVANHAIHWVHSLQSKTRSELDFSFVHIFSGAPRCAHALIKCVLSCCCCCCSWPTNRGAPKQRLILRPKCQLFSSAVPKCEREWERRERESWSGIQRQQLRGEECHRVKVTVNSFDPFRYLPYTL